MRLQPVTAEAEYPKSVRERLAGYPKLAREALRRREYAKAEEYWRLWHEGVNELVKHFGNVDRPNGGS